MIPVLGSAPSALDAGHELAELLQYRSNNALFRRASDGHHLTLRAALDELDAWLNDSRPYTGYHKKPWQTMAEDVREALADRGQRTQRETAAIDVLIQKLQPPAMGDDPARKTDWQQQLGLVRVELAQPTIAVAAFDDLLIATEDLATPSTRLEDLADTFGDCLRAAGRTVRNVLEGVSGVLRNNLLQVKFVREKLGEDANINVREDLEADAQLSLSDRADLCRRLLAAQDPPYYNVVWLCFEEAQVRLTSIGFGPVTFFDGPQLVEAVEKGNELYQHVEHEDGSHGFSLIEIPTEISKPEGQPFGRPFDWPDLEHWVAARIDLGRTPLTDPVSAGIQEVERVVRLTGFQQGGTSWRQMNGYHHITDGAGGSRSFFRPAQDPLSRFLTDETDFALGRLSIKLGPHLPVTDSHLRDLLDAAALLDWHHEDIDVSSIRISVSVIDRVAGLTPVEWQEHLTRNFAIPWARRIISLMIREGVGYAEQRLNAVPDDVYSWTAGARHIHLDAAIVAIPGLLADLPPHDQVARTLRTVAARTTSPHALQDWVDELVSLYRRLTNRLLRCRNSLAHGGPLSEDTGRTVLTFAWNEARRTINLALWAVLAGNTSTQAHQNHQQKNQQWRDSLGSLATVSDAFK